MCLHVRQTFAPTTKHRAFENTSQANLRRKESVKLAAVKLMLVVPVRPSLTHLDTCRPTTVHLHRYTPHVRLI